MINTPRRYPQVFKFAMVALLAFDLYVMYYANCRIRCYCIIMFFVILNGWASSEDDSFEYYDLYLLIDTFCSALYFIVLLDLYNDVYINFWIISCLTFFVYWLWNKLLEKKAYYLRQEKKHLHVYNVCDLLASVYCLVAFIILKNINNDELSNLMQITGGIMWVTLLGKWYYDFYIKTFFTR